MDDLIFRRRRGDGTKGMSEFNRVRDDLALGITLDELEAPVRIQRRTDVEAFFGAKVPCATRGWFSMDKHTTPNRA